MLQLNLDDGVHRPGVGRVRGRQVGDDAQLGDDQLQVFAKLFADKVLDLGDQLLGLFDSRAARCPGIDLECARVDFRKELAAQSWPQDRRSPRPATRQPPAPRRDDNSSRDRAARTYQAIPASITASHRANSTARTDRAGRPAVVRALLGSLTDHDDRRDARCRDQHRVHAWPPCGFSQRAERDGTNVRDKK